MTKKRMRKSKIGILTFIFCLLMMAVFPSMDTHAEELDILKDVTLTIQYTYANEPVAGAAFDIYHFADLSEDGTYTISETFKKYPISIDNLDDEAWKSLATTLNGYVKNDGITPYDSGSTDKNGILTFPKNQTLKQGIYLVLGHVLETETYIYTSTPFLVQVPGPDFTAHTWEYNVTAAPKCLRDDLMKDGIKRKVIKVWDDKGKENSRPEEIEVSLLQNDTVYDTVTLNEKNNWRHTWKELETGYEYTVVEKEQKGYEVMVAEEGITFVVTNRATDDIPDDFITPPGDELIPQTGQLWWPIPMLFAFGLLCIAVGLMCRRGNRREEE